MCITVLLPKLVSALVVRCRHVSICNQSQIEDEPNHRQKQIGSAKVYVLVCNHWHLNCATPFCKKFMFLYVIIVLLRIHIAFNTLVLSWIYFMRFSTSTPLHIKDHLKAYLGYKSCPRTLGREDLVYGGTRTHDLSVP